MTAQELIQLDASEVRSSSSLMSIYKRVFKETFGREPSCAICTFKNDFQRLKNHYSQNQSNLKIMSENKTFELKRQHMQDLFSYTKYDENKSRPVTYRNYGYGLTDDFVNEMFANKTEEEALELKQKFSKLPVVEEENPVLEEVTEPEQEPEAEQDTTVEETPVVEAPVVEEEKPNRGRKAKTVEETPENI